MTTLFMESIHLKISLELFNICVVEKYRMVLCTYSNYIEGKRSSGLSDSKD
jgi:hypothetical protein